MKYYDNPSEQAAFERWTALTAELLQKYGPAFLRAKGDPLSPREVNTRSNAAPKDQFPANNSKEVIALDAKSDAA